MTACKLCQHETFEKFRISWAQVPAPILECRACGFRFLDILDQPENSADPSVLTARDEQYIRFSLQSNHERFSWQLALLQKYLCSKPATVLDVGAGGGLFLHLARGAGFTVLGSEPNSVRRQFADREYGLTLNDELLEDPFWDRYLGKLDAVTLWDVIEHVNDPAALLTRAHALLRPSGVLLMDTPARDGAFYRSGELSYRVSGGKWPFLLKSMYSPERFGHKQIFLVAEMQRLLSELSFDVVEARRFHELSFPRTFYLQRLLRSTLAAQIADPLAKGVLKILPVKNKMVIAARTSGAHSNTSAQSTTAAQCA